MTATYRFLPWVRRGIAAAIQDPDTLGAGVPVRTRMPVEVHVDGTEARPAVALHGPGDVIALDSTAVVQTDPAPDSVGVETARFPSVELRSPELPWLFTPAAADRRGRLRPWLCLVVVPVDVAGAPAPQAADRPPSVTLPAEELPDPAETWAWAHVQVVADDPDTPVVELLAGESDRAVARLLCPRRLRPDTRYRALLVPTFEAGRRAGLGLDPAEDETTLRPAWPTSAQERVELPVYFHWAFETGAGGDFSSLAARLSPRAALEGLGTRPVDVGALTGDLTRAPVLRLPGALRAPRPDKDDAQDEDEEVLAAAHEALRAVLERTRDGEADVPVVGPPLYGGWQAVTDELPAPEKPPRWLRELNVDPRHRAAAALGALVVRERQHELMAAAWQQVGEADDAAQVLRQGQLAREAARATHRRLAALPAGDVLGVTDGVQRRLLWTEGTAWTRLRSTRLPAAATSPTLRRLARPRGPLARRAGAPGRRLAGAMAAELTAGALSAVPPTSNPTDLDDRDNVLSPSALGPQSRAARMRPSADGFDEALADSAARLQQSLNFTGPVAQPSVRPAELAEGLLERLDPDETVTARVRDRLRERESPREDAADVLEPVVAAPRFPQPMYAALRDVDVDAFAPGLDRLASESATLLEADPAFVESFMVGLNHEMGRELRWRGYPNDQRGTYFSSFWGGSWPYGRTWRIHRWPRDSALGDNHPETAEEDGLLVLALRGELLRRYPEAGVYAARAVVAQGVRVPGDEQREARFEGRAGPDVTIAGFALTAAEARSGDGREGWFFVIEQPAGTPGFGIHPSTAPAAPEDLDDWDALTWGHLTTEGASGPPEHAPVDGPLAGLRLDDFDDLEWGLNAAHMARITLRRPVRVAIHADELLADESLPGEEERR